MEAAGADAGGGAGGSDDPPESREGQQGQQGLGGEGAEAAVPGEAPRVPGQQQVPGPGGDAFSTVGGPETLIHEFAICVPFPSPLESEMACAFLNPDDEPLRSLVEREVTVFGSILAVRWKTENPFLLRISVNDFLEQLSLVMQTMPRFRPRVSR